MKTVSPAHMLLLLLLPLLLTVVVSSINAWINSRLLSPKYNRFNFLEAEFATFLIFRLCSDAQKFEWTMVSNVG